MMKSFISQMAIVMGLFFTFPFPASASAQINPFASFAGSYTVVGAVSIDNWNFTSCNLWDLPNAKAVSISVDPKNTEVYKLSIDTGSGMYAVESLGDFSCGGECYYRTSSREGSRKEATSVYVPNGFNSATSRGVVVKNNQIQNSLELFVADVTYDLTSGVYSKSGYCYYKMKLQH